ncbi:serine hydrolase [Micromonospora haikouensis]|uniref:serine hydrolase domain-containing protein n=1 Tax=Micromonospora haikouensis TaxID=686309 RepID=UPI0037B62437
MRDACRGLVVGLATAVAVSLGGASPAAATAPSHRAQADETEIQQALEELRQAAGAPGAAVSYTDGAGSIRLGSGVTHIHTLEPFTAAHRVRIASNTKTFTATMILQLVDEGLVELDEPVETFLPGVIRFPRHGEDRDGRTITVRNLLQHTSGIADRAGSTAQGTVSTSLAAGSQSVPGTTPLYSNANFVLAGWILEGVTGSAYSTALDERIVRPLGLQATYNPAVGDVQIQGAHSRGHYSYLGSLFVDVTTTDPHWSGAAGTIISDMQDTDAFYRALLGGRLISPASLRELQTVHGAYGLGIGRSDLSCGVTVWNHFGALAGYGTMGAATDDGRSVAAAVNAWPGGRPYLGGKWNELLEAALC